MKIIILIKKYVTVDVPADSHVRRLDQCTSHSMADRVFPHGGHGCPPVRQ